MKRESLADKFINGNHGLKFSTDVDSVLDLNLYPQVHWEVYVKIIDKWRSKFYDQIDLQFSTLETKLNKTYET